MIQSTSARNRCKRPVGRFSCEISPIMSAALALPEDEVDPCPR